MDLRLVILLVIASIWANSTFGQLTIRHLEKERISQNNQRTLKQYQTPEPLSLPFWDDFSQSDGQPDPELWFNSENTNINPTLGKNPPTLNVATFDGTDAFGTPYDISSQFVGNTDNLISRSIDLSVIAANKLNTVFLSFFWQAKGNGEIPNENDSLRLQFLTSDSVWVTQFVISGGDNAIRTNNQGSEVFTQEIIRVDDARFFHDKFRFRFQSFGRLTGGFDTWHIDYVFLNQDRDFADLSYFDRGITQPPTSLFGDFSAIPADQYFTDPAALITPLNFELFNLDALPHPIEFSLNVYDLTTNRLIDRTNEPTTAPILSGLERRRLDTNLPDLSGLQFSDSIVLETEIIYNTGDNNLIEFINPVTGDTTFYGNVDFKVNDTLRRQFVIQDYLAYDDGTAEFAAGINQIRGRLAYLYYLPQPDTLTDIEIYFPRIAPASDGLPIEIIVWERLSDDVGSILAKQPFTIQSAQELNQFNRYTLEFPLLVSDSIYIGWEQFSDNFIGVGLDKNTDTGERIYVNVDGDWRQNIGIEGSLMLRPRFRRSEKKIITSVGDELIEDLRLYPNPNNGSFTTNMNFDNLHILDVLGREISYIQTGETIQLLNARPGIYHARFKITKSLIWKRIIVE